MEGPITTIIYGLVAEWFIAGCSTVMILGSLQVRFLPNSTFHGETRMGMEHSAAGHSPTFEWALGSLKHGHRVRRKGWNGEGMFLYLVEGSTFNGTMARPPLDEIYKDSDMIQYQPHIDIQTADGSLVPWVASQTDLLAEDWEFVK